MSNLLTTPGAYQSAGNFGTVTALETPSHGRPASLELYLPPQSLLILALRSAEPLKK